MNDEIRELQPDYYRNIDEFIALAKTEDKHFNDIDAYIKQQLDNLFITTSNEDGVYILEDAYNIPTNVNSSLEDRKSQIKLRQLPPQPMTIKYFNYMLKNLGLEVFVKLDTDNLALTAYIDTDSYTDSQINRLEDIMATYLPANITIKIYRYQHGKTVLNNYIGVANSLHFHGHADVNLSDINTKGDN